MVSTTESSPMVNAFDPNALAELAPQTQELIERRQNVLGPGYKLQYNDPVTVVRGRGAYLYDADGNEYLDAYNNVPCVGHCHPHVVEAVHRQLQNLNTNTRYIQHKLIEYSERLISTFPDPLQRVTYACTGSEANDLALRVARHYTGNEGIVVTETAYHGITAQIAAISPSLGEGSPLGPHVRAIKPPHPAYLGEQSAEEFMRDQVRAAIGQLHRHGFGLAAVVVDSILTSDGIFPHPAGFLKPLVEEAHAAGGLYIADEVQSGFLRLGEAWWGFQRHGIVPDMVTMGKPMGNGTPVSAVVFTPEVMEDFDRKVRYFNTFGGSSMPIAAADAVMDVLIEENLGERAVHTGVTLKRGIEGALSSLEQPVNVRGVGLCIGVEFSTSRGAPDAEAASAVVNDLRQRQVLISASGPEGNVLKIRPPLAFGETEAKRFLDVFHKTIDTVLNP